MKRRLPSAARLSVPLASAIAALLAAAPPLVAQTIYDWQLTAPDGNWKQGAGGAARWNPGGLWDEPVSGTGAVLRFDNNHQLAMSNNVGVSPYAIHGLIFGSSNTSARTINNGTIRFFDFGGTDPYISNDSSATHVINSALEGDGATDPLKIYINSSGGLTFGGTINNQGTWIDVVGSTGSAATVSFNGAISGGGGVFKANANTTLVLAAQNTYSGGTILSNGTLLINNGGNSSSNSAIGTGTFTIEAGTIDNTSGAASSTVTLLTNNALALNGNFAYTGTGSRNLNLGTGAVTMAATRTITVNGGNLTIGGNIASTGAEIVKAGTGTLSLTGANSYSGATNINGGTLEVGGATGALSGTSAVSINGGTLLLSGGTANSRIADGANFTTAGASTIRLSGVAGFSETVNSLTLGAGTNVIDFGTLTGMGINVLTFASLAGGGAATLQVWNWTSGTDSLRIASGLPGDTNLANVSFFSGNGPSSPLGGGGAMFDGINLVPVPEPSALLATGALGAAALFRRRRPAQATATR